MTLTRKSKGDQPRIWTAPATLVPAFAAFVSLGLMVVTAKYYAAAASKHEIELVSRECKLVTQEHEYKLSLLRDQHKDLIAKIPVAQEELKRLEYAIENGTFNAGQVKFGIKQDEAKAKELSDQIQADRERLSVLSAVLAEASKKQIEAEERLLQLNRLVESGQNRFNEMSDAVIAVTQRLQHVNDQATQAEKNLEVLRAKIKSSEATVEQAVLSANR